MPFSNASIITFMGVVAPGYDVAVPQTADACQLLRAVFSKTRLPQSEAMMRENRLRVNRPFSADRLQTVEVEVLRPMDPALLCVVTVNTRQGLEAVARVTGRID